MRRDPPPPPTTLDPLDSQKVALEGPLRQLTKVLYRAQRLHRRAQVLAEVLARPGEEGAWTR